MQTGKSPGEKERDSSKTKSLRVSKLKAKRGKLQISRSRKLCNHISLSVKSVKLDDTNNVNSHRKFCLIKKEC